MQRWIVILKDCAEAEASQFREQRFAEHLSFLQENFDRIVFSCGLKDVSHAPEKPYGGFWMVEAEDKAQLEELIRNDPYFDLGLRANIEIFRAHEGYI